jgi:hypothetical protein
MMGGDDLRDSYVAWREAASGVQAAYERWIEWGSADRHVAFAGYAAALQHERHAARLYEQQLELVRLGLGTHDVLEHERRESMSTEPKGNGAGAAGRAA